jgi:hypothetical protein
MASYLRHTRTYKVCCGFDVTLRVFFCCAYSTASCCRTSVYTRTVPLPAHTTLQPAIVHQDLMAPALNNLCQRCPARRESVEGSIDERSSIRCVLQVR